MIHFPEANNDTDTDIDAKKADTDLTLITKKQVSDQLACSQNMVYLHHEEWHIRRVHLTSDPKTLRFIKQDVQRFIRERLSLEEQNAL